MVRFLHLAALLLPLLFSTREMLATDFNKDVQPVFKKYCVGCHNDSDMEGDFSLESYASLQKGVAESLVYVKGKAQESHLIRLMKGSKQPAMPPEDEPQPSPKEIAIIEKWINEGAKPPKKDSSARLSLMVPAIESKTQLAPVTSLDISLDGKWMAVGHFGKLDLFHANQEHQFDLKKPTKTFDSFPGKITSVHFSHDSSKLIAASGVTGLGGYAAFFDLDTFQVIQEIKGHQDVLYDAEISPDESIIATCSYDQNIILWDLKTGKKIRELSGHNGAVFDIDFSPDSRLLVSASADETCKVWRIADGVRLDTLPQPLEEVYCCAFSPDGKQIVCGGADNNIRVWELASIKEPKINPMIFARYAHEGPVLQLKFSVDGSRLISMSEDLTLKVWETQQYREIASWKEQEDVGFALATSQQADEIFLGKMNGTIQTYQFPNVEPVEPNKITTELKSIEISSSLIEKLKEIEPNNTPQTAQSVVAPLTITGLIHDESQSPDVDYYKFSAKAGQTWVIEINAARAGSKLDSFIEVVDSSGNSIPRVQLQAIRDSYFTFRGKDDATSNDFRVFNWQEMSLDQYLYCNGEVVKLWLYPRGPDSGYMVYPGQGKRWGFFDTTPLAHALGEPCYIVQAFAPEEKLIPNGLPVFKLYYENDDQSLRQFGRDSQLFFTVPADGDYLVKLKDVRDEEGKDRTYQLTIRPQQQNFKATLHGKDFQIPPGGAREFRVTVNRTDRFEGPVQIDVKNLPAGYQVSTPLIIEAGQIEAHGLIMASTQAKAIDEAQSKLIEVTASATINNQKVTQKVINFGKLTIKPDPKFTVQIVPAEQGIQPIQSPENGPLEFQVKSGETVMLKVVADRKQHKGNITFGKEGAGRNLPFGAYVDNIGLNGLMMLASENERDFFITVDPVTKPQTRLFHLKASEDGGTCTMPVKLHIIP